MHTWRRLLRVQMDVSVGVLFTHMLSADWSIILDIFTCSTVCWAVYVAELCMYKIETALSPQSCQGKEAYTHHSHTSTDRRGGIPTATRVQYLVMQKDQAWKLTREMRVRTKCCKAWMYPLAMGSAHASTCCKSCTKTRYVLPVYNTKSCLQNKPRLALQSSDGVLFIGVNTLDNASKTSQMLCLIISGYFTRNIFLVLV